MRAETRRTVAAGPVPERRRAPPGGRRCVLVTLSSQSGVGMQSRCRPVATAAQWKRCPYGTDLASFLGVPRFHLISEDFHRNQSGRRFGTRWSDGRLSSLRCQALQGARINWFSWRSAGFVSRRRFPATTARSNDSGESSQACVPSREPPTCSDQPRCVGDILRFGCRQSATIVRRASTDLQPSS